jgi:hypothetical protein
MQIIAGIFRIFFLHHTRDSQAEAENRFFSAVVHLMTGIGTGIALSA